MTEAPELESDPLIDSSFRRLMVAINNERDQLRTGWKALKDEKELHRKEAILMKQEADAYCDKEKAKIEKMTKEITKIQESLTNLMPDVDDTHIFALCVSGTNIDVPAGVIKAVPDSYLCHMFSDGFIDQLPNREGRYVLDFHPECFQIIINYLHAVSLAKKMRQPDPAVPFVPLELKVPMSVIVEALKLDAFTPPNLIRPGGTSLVTDEQNKVLATCQGWQITSALYPLNPARETGFSVKILKNPDPRGGLAIGLVGKAPTGNLIHQLVQPTGVLYNSNNGIVMSPVVKTNDTKKGLPFKEGTLIVVKYTPKQRKVQWYMNGQSLGHVIVKQDDEESAEMYPCVALFAPDQTIQIDFKISPVSG